MANFEDLNLIFENLVSYFTGSYTVLAIIILSIFMLVLLARGLSLRYASLFLLPFAGFFVAIGWFGNLGLSQWIVNLILIVVGLFYAWAVIRITT